MTTNSVSAEYFRTKHTDNVYVECYLLGLVVLLAQQSKLHRFVLSERGYQEKGISDSVLLEEQGNLSHCFGILTALLPVRVKEKSQKAGEDSISYIRSEAPPQRFVWGNYIKEGSV